MESSTFNLFYLNNILGDVTADGTNLFNSTSKLSYTFNGRNYVGHLGNYYGTCSDSNEDGVCDSPRVLAQNNTDYYPLSREWVYYVQRTSNELPDLYIQSFNPPILVTGQEAMLIIEIGNNGTSASGPFNVTVQIEDFLEERRFEGLNPGESVIFDFNWTPSSPGSHKINITVDNNSEVEESDESNNHVEYSLNVLESGENDNLKVFLVPTKTNVTPGGYFVLKALLEINDSTFNINSFLLNLSYDKNKLEVQKIESDLDWTISFSSGGVNWLSFIGARKDPITLTNGSNLLNISFRVAEDVQAGDYINFNVNKININGNNVHYTTLTVLVVEIQQEPWQTYDTDGNGLIGDGELIDAIMDWLDNQLKDEELLK